MVDVLASVEGVPSLVVGTPASATGSYASVALTAPSSARRRDDVVDGDTMWSMLAPHTAHLSPEDTRSLRAALEVLLRKAELVALADVFETYRSKLQTGAVRQDPLALPASAKPRRRKRR